GPTRRTRDRVHGRGSRKHRSHVALNRDRMRFEALVSGNLEPKTDHGEVLPTQSTSNILLDQYRRDRDPLRRLRGLRRGSCGLRMTLFVELPFPLGKPSVLMRTRVIERIITHELKPRCGFCHSPGERGAVGKIRLLRPYSS